MRDVQTIATDKRGVCQAVCLSRDSTRLHCAGSFDTAFDKSLWLLVFF